MTDINSIVDYLIRTMTDAEDSRYEFEWAVGTVLSIYDRQNDRAYKVVVNEFEEVADV